MDVVIAEDESWMHCWDPQLKAQTREWLAQGETCPEKVRIEQSVQKVMLVAFIEKDRLVSLCPMDMGLDRISIFKFCNVFWLCSGGNAHIWQQGKACPLGLCYTMGLPHIALTEWCDS